MSRTNLENDLNMTVEVKGHDVPSWMKKKYLVAEEWGHCFVGSKESTVRWVLEIGVGVIAGQVLNRGKWEDMHRSEIADMQEEIDDNSIVDVWQADFGDSITMVIELPDWAKPDAAVVQERDARTIPQDQVDVAERTLRSLWAHQRSRKAFDTVLTLRLSDAAKTLVGWAVTRNEDVLRRSHPFTRETMGWSIQRERAHDDSRRHVRKLPVSPESLSTGVMA